MYKRLPIFEEYISGISKSVAQQQKMGIAYSIKKGDAKLSDYGNDPDLERMVDGMTLKQLKDFASTKHDGLPKYVPKK